MTKQIVWVVESGEKGEGGRVVAACKYRTSARVIKRDIQRGEWFFHECDYVAIRKVVLIQHPMFVKMQPWEAVGDETL